MFLPTVINRGHPVPTTTVTQFSTYDVENALRPASTPRHRSSAVTEDDGRVDGLRVRLELALSVENRALRRAEDISIDGSRESAAEHDAR